MLKCVITRLAAEPRPGPLGELKCTPDPLAAMGKPTSKGKGREREGEEGLSSVRKKIIVTALTTRQGRIQSCLLGGTNPLPFPSPPLLPLPSGAVLGKKHWGAWPPKFPSPPLFLTFFASLTPWPLELSLPSLSPSPPYPLPLPSTFLFPDPILSIPVPLSFPSLPSL